VCAVVSQRDLFRGALLRALGYGGRAEESMLRQVVIKEAMSETVVTTGPDAPLAEAARAMVEHKVGCLPVVEGEKLVGILTETDVVRLVAEGKLRPA
jgi:CBS domain-containing protein